MNCRDAEPLIFAARDGALDDSRRAALAEHLGACRACQAVQSELATAATTWRAADAAVPTPAVEAEWHAIRRRIRANAPDDASVVPAWWRRPLGWGLATATAAALALAFFIGPSASNRVPALEARDGAYVSYVTVYNTSDAAMVFEDAESGWLVVWVTDDPATSGT